MSPRSLRLAAALALALACAVGCRTVGEDFATAPIAELRLGETPGDEVRTLFGEPYKVAQHRAPELRSEILYYRRAEGTAQGGKGRVLAVELADGTLRGWLFDSSMPEDSTEFDAAAREGLATGSSTREEVLEALGEPSGRCLLPSNLAVQHVDEPFPEGAVELWLWRHTTIDRNLVFLSSHSRVLALAFDGEGLLLQVQYRE